MVILGCFTADNIHVEVDGTLVTEVHRGCSSFREQNVTCTHISYNDSKFDLKSEFAELQIFV